MDASQQLKYLAPFLDPHLLHCLLKRNCEKESADICAQLRASFLSQQNKQEAQKRESDAAKKAQKLVTLLQSTADTD